MRALHSMLSLSVILSCAAVGPQQPLDERQTEAVDAEGGGWSPSADGPGALAALWSSKPFELPAPQLAVASGGLVPTAHRHEGLLYENTTRLEVSGRSTERERMVYRVLNNHPDQTLTFTWAPWRTEKPTIRVRVVSPEGAESWLDPSTVIEGSASVDDLQLTDLRQLQVPLPNVRRGSVIEYTLVTEYTRQMLEGGGASATWSLWSREPSRRMRLRVEVPKSAPLKVEAIGIAEPTIQTEGETQIVSVDVERIDFKPYSKSRTQVWAELPRFSWSTAASWADVARRYQPLLAAGLSDAIDWSQLPSSVTGAKTDLDKAQAVVRWVSDRVRYTAVHLGQGAIVPTKPSLVLSRGYGDCKDLSVLVAAVLRHVGVSADVALVPAGVRPPSDAIAGLEAFNHMVVVMPGPKGHVWLDPTAPAYPVGVVPASVRHRRALLISSTGAGLINTPTAAETSLEVSQRVDVTLSSFGKGKATLTLKGLGAAEGLYRSATDRCDDKVAHDAMAGFAQAAVGNVSFTAKASGCKSGEGPYTLTAEVPEVDRTETSDSSATVALASRIVDTVMPDDVMPDEEDDRSDKQKEDEAKRFLAHNGYPISDIELAAYSFDARLVSERFVHIAVPEAFTIENLPPNRTLAMGPSTWSETFTQLKNGDVEVHYRFELNTFEWSKADITAFRDALTKRFAENMVVLAFTLTPLKLLHDRKPREAMASMKRLLEARPHDGVLRARYAQQLLRLGLAELARIEIDRALQDAPKEAMVLMVCGDIARSNRNGLRYSPPFARATAIDCLRRAVAELPDHGWANEALADTLRRNDQGEQETGWGPDLIEAATTLQRLHDRKEASDEALKMLGELYARNGRAAELTKLFKDDPTALSSNNDGLNAMIEALISGVDATLARLQRINDPHTKLTSFLMAYGIFAQIKHYDDAIALMNRFDPGEPLRPQFSVLKNMNLAMKPVPDTINVSSPENAAKSLCAAASNAKSRTDVAQRWAKLASATGKNELDGRSELFRFVVVPSLDSTFMYDQLYHRGKCVVSGNAILSRVRCEMPENHAVALTSYWSRDRSGSYKLESLGRLSQLADRAWAENLAKHPDEAALWVGWLVDALEGRGSNTGHAAMLLKDLWSPAAKNDPEAMQLVTALAQLLYSDMSALAAPAVVDAFDKARSTLSGALRRRADLVLVSVRSSRDEFAKARETLKGLAESENEPDLWRTLTNLEAKDGQSAAALERIEKALDKDKTNAAWLSTKGLVLLEAGRFSDAYESLKGLEAAKGAAADIRNNLLWAQTLAGKLDEAAEREASGLAEHAGEAELNTLSMLMLERGRVVEAARYGSQRQARMGTEVDDPQRLYRARLLQVLGFGDAASQMYGQISGKASEWVHIKKRFSVAQAQ